MQMEVTQSIFWIPSGTGSYMTNIVQKVLRVLLQEPPKHK